MSQKKGYKVGFYTTRNATELKKEIIYARNLSEAREIAQVYHQANHIKYAHTFEYVELPSEKFVLTE